MQELSLFYLVVLLSTGLLAGVINTLAGGGSNLTIPALMLMGMPPDIANATNRVGVFLQSVVGVRGFRQHGRLSSRGLKGVALTTLCGGLLGAAFASYMPAWLLKPLLVGTMVTMALVILLKPSVEAQLDSQSQVLTVLESPSSLWMLFLAGVYGGFVQAGVGFVLLAVLSGNMGYDLVRANAVKVLCTAVFTAVALVIFIARDQILWGPGLVLACGAMVGAHLAVKLTIKISQRTLKWFVFLMTLFVGSMALIQ
jgi:uncharacterized protein